MKASDYFLARGKTLRNGKYTIEEKLGSGGFGITYKGLYIKEVNIKERFHDMKTTVTLPVAIKELFIEGKCVRNVGASSISLQSLPTADYQTFKNRFLKEAETLSQFRDVPEIVHVIDYFEENDTAYMVMEFVEGETLSQLVKRKGPLKEGEAVDYISQIGNGLDHVHKQNIIHRDIKPDNIIITPAGTAVLIDFGAARGFVADKSVTQSVILTHGYAPIEQYSEKRKRGAYTDIYALAGTLIFCLTGEKPESIYDRGMDDTVQMDHISKSLLTVINKAFAFNGKERYQSCQVFINNLNSATSGENEDFYKTKISNIYRNDQYDKKSSNGNNKYEAGTVELRNKQQKKPTLVRKNKETYFGIAVASFLAILIIFNVINIWFSNDKTHQEVTKDKFDQLKEEADNFATDQDWENALKKYKEASAIESSDEVQDSILSISKKIESARIPYVADEETLTNDSTKSNFETHDGTDTEEDSSINREKVVSFTQAKKFYDQRNYDEALPALLTLEKKGNTAVRDYIAAIYFRNAEQKQNTQNALSWYNTSIKSGYTTGYFYLTRIYYQGLGVANDDVRAFEYAKTGYGLGNPGCTFLVGSFYSVGIGVGKNASKAETYFKPDQLTWLKEAKSKTSLPLFDYLLGVAYNYGHGIDKNYNKAYEYYKIAAEQGSAQAQNNLGSLYEYGIGADQDYKMALFWYRKAANQGHANSQNNIGWMYRLGKGVAQDYKAAHKWYKLSADQGNSIAQYNLGSLYNHGQGVAQDYKAAYKWYKLSADHGNSAQYNLGSLYYHGQGVAQDYKAAYKWFKLAADQGHSKAQTNLGLMHIRGEGVKIDDDKAFEYFQKAAKGGNIKEAQNNLGFMYKEGRGTTKNILLAKQWYQKSCDNGYMPACETLSTDFD